MNMDFFTEMKEHRNLSEELHATPWWQSIMHNPDFQAAYARNHHMRFKLSDSSYLKQLLRSESERRLFEEQVMHPEPEHLTDPYED